MQSLEILRFTYGPFAENTYVVVGPSGSSAMLVDPGFDSEPIWDLLCERGLSISLIVNTHGHLDHVAGNAFYKRKSQAPLAIHAGDLPFLRNLKSQASMYGLTAEESPEPEMLLSEGVPVEFDGTAFDVIHTPGHSPGGVCLLRGRQMLVGDTLFHGSVGRTDLPGGDWNTLLTSVRSKLFALPNEVRCYPGHEAETTIGRERAENPFVGDAAVGVTR